MCLQKSNGSFALLHNCIRIRPAGCWIGTVDHAAPNVRRLESSQYGAIACVRLLAATAHLLWTDLHSASLVDWADMATRVDLYDSTYGNFKEQTLAEVRRETYGEDIGQNSWITAAEYDTFYSWLKLAPRSHVLDAASGSGGPALYLARTHGCRITGIDINEEGLDTARLAALATGIDDAEFQSADMDQRLPFDAETFDAIVCIDAMNHFRDRLGVLREWHRVLKPGGRILFTDPVVPTGPVSNDELATRSNIGFFLFVPLDVTQRLIDEAGFHLLRRENVTGNIELTSGRWYAARYRHRKDLLQIEGQERFEGLQRFLFSVYKLTSERRLSRFVFVAQK
jgi:ubiquinone/menaquinone biosynthesis C-methylase UbiE